MPKLKRTKPRRKAGRKAAYSRKAPLKLEPRKPKRSIHIDISRSMSIVTRSTSIDLIPFGKSVSKEGSLQANRDNQLWPVEEHALEDIHTGKTKTVDVSGEDFLKEIRSAINERTNKTT